MSTDQRPGTPYLSRAAAPSPERAAESPVRPRRHLRALADRRARMMPLGSAPLPADWPGDTDGNPADGPIACEVANRMVGLLRKHAGRGPTKSKCAITEDLVVVTLDDCLTTLETRLAAAGSIDLVRRVRRAIHQEMRSEATAIVEELTQRNVVAYLPAEDHDPDLAILVFHLDGYEPPGFRFSRDPSAVFPGSADSAPVQTAQEADPAPPGGRSDARGLPARFRSALW